MKYKTRYNKERYRRIWIRKEVYEVLVRVCRTDLSTCIAEALKAYLSQISVPVSRPESVPDSGPDITANSAPDSGALSRPDIPRRHSMKKSGRKTPGSEDRLKDPEYDEELEKAVQEVFAQLEKELEGEA